MPENLRLSSPTRWREPLLSARSSTLCTVLFTAHSLHISLTHTYTTNHLSCPHRTEKLLTLGDVKFGLSQKAKTKGLD